MAKAKRKGDAQGASEPLHWLHLSDLHLGARGKAEVAQVEAEFFRSLRETVPKVGVPDVVLITGDVTATGATRESTEYDLVDAFLGRLDGELEELGAVTPLPVVPCRETTRSSGSAKTMTI